MPTSRFLSRLNTLHHRRPLVVATLIGTGSLRVQLDQARRSKTDVLEIRLDTFRLPSSSIVEAVLFSQSLIRVIREKWSKLVLLTLRSPRESPSKISHIRRWPDKKRGRLLTELLPLCDAVDVEIKSRALATSITRLARRRGVAVIHSFHDFKGMPATGVLKRHLDASRRLKGDLFKAAVTPKTDVELRSFLAWGKSIVRPQPVLIAMGPLGAGTRPLGFCFGSVMTYGHLGSSAAPGQTPVNVLMKEVRALYGD